MTVDSPLSCYICGKTTDERMTIDMKGCLKDQKAASERFEEKHGEEPGGLIDVCAECEDENPHHARNTKQKYGVHD